MRCLCIVNVLTLPEPIAYSLYCHLGEVANQARYKEHVVANYTMSGQSMYITTVESHYKEHT